MINKPEFLIRFQYCHKGAYCSVGWLAKEAGIVVTEKSSPENTDVDFELDASVAEKYNINLKSIQTLRDLTDGEPDQEKRVLKFTKWCDDFGVKFYENS